MVTEATDFDDLFEDEDSIEPGQEPLPAGGEGGEDPDGNDPDNGEEPPAGDPPPGDPPAGDPPPAKNALELFLEKHNILDGVIEFSDGSKTHINEMTPEEQMNVLAYLASISPAPASPDVPSETESQFLKMLREKNLTVDQYLQQEVNGQLMRERASANFGGDVDYAAMSAEEVYAKFLKERDPDITDEDLTTELELAKGSKQYEKTVGYLRDQFSAQQDAQRQEWIDGIRAQEAQELENDRTTIVAAVQSIDNVAGWEVTDAVKNDVLADLLEVDHNGDSAFMRDVLTNPEKLFQAAWYMKYGEASFKRLEEYYKAEISKAYEKGKSEVAAKPPTQGGMPKPPVKTFNKETQSSAQPAPGQGTPAPSTRKPTVEKYVDFDDVHDDE